ncbi:hypothetical protein [Nocardia sp. CA-145437]|uniref:hypothetical protein n=1 Tax=Nocardia sp. CA-145437 TaxID=3239980 RepID=UPI003D998273
MSWKAQAICVDCWHRAHPAHRAPAREDGPQDRCVMCGNETRAGLYERLDTEAVPFPAPDYDDPFDRPLGYDYEVLPDGRVPVWIMGGIGDQARAVTPWRKHDNPATLSIAEIARDAGIAPGEVVGREFFAAGDEHKLTDFRLKHDPRK